jgi:hypothetical protein
MATFREGGMKVKQCVTCKYLKWRIEFDDNGRPVNEFFCYYEEQPVKLNEINQCPKPWEPPEYIKRMSVERANLLDKIKKLEDFLEDHDGIDMADSYLMHQQVYVMQEYVNILTTRIVHDTTKEKAKRNE